MLLDREYPVLGLEAHCAHSDIVCGVPKEPWLFEQSSNSYGIPGEMWENEYRANKHLRCALIVAIVINSCYCSQISDKLQTRKSQWYQEGAFLYI